MQLKKLLAVTLSLFVSLAVFATNAEAQLVGHTVSQTPGLGGQSNFTANRLAIDFNGTLSGVQAILNLSQGTLFQEPTFGADTAPNAALFPVAPAVEADSFISIGGYTSGTSLAPIIVGAAVNLDPMGSRQFDNMGINLAWSPPTSTTGDPKNQTNYPVAQFTLSNDATGSLQFLASAAGVVSAPITLDVVNGVIGGSTPVIPEPSTVVLLGMGLIGLVAMKRRVR